MRTTRVTVSQRDLRRSCKFGQTQLARDRDQD